MVEELKVALVQTDLVWESPEENRQNIQKEIERLAGKADLILLPEMFPTGFSMHADQLCEPPKGASFQWMQRIASQTGAAVTGSIITKEGSKYYNRLYFVFPDGGFEQYDKRHTFSYAGEDKVYDRGKERVVVSFKGWKILPLVCYDLRFPVWSRNQDDYDILLYVANWPAARTRAWDILLEARAIENMAYCIGVNRIGTDGNNLPYVGHSAVYDSQGKRISGELEENQRNIIQVLRKKDLQESRAHFGFLKDRDAFTLQ